MKSATAVAAFKKLQAEFSAASEAGKKAERARLKAVKNQEAARRKMKAARKKAKQAKRRARAAKKTARVARKLVVKLGAKLEKMTGRAGAEKNRASKPRARRRPGRRSPVKTASVRPRPRPPTAEERTPPGLRGQPQAGNVDRPDAEPVQGPV